MRTYQRIAPTLAIILALAALCMGGALAATGKIVITSTKQIKNGVVTTQDVKNGTVGTADVRNGAVKSTDVAKDTIAGADIAPAAVDTGEIAAGGVEVQDADFPAPDESTEPPGDVASAEVGAEYALVDPVAPQVKESGETDLEVVWGGTAQAGFSPCVFQVRVDGQPAGGSAGEHYVPNGQAESVTVQATFEGLTAGPHQVEVWARSTGGPTTCTVGPGSLGIGQAFTQKELVH